MEERRARRDHITKLFESARDDVRRAVENAIDYFSAETGKRTKLQESKVIMSDRELREAIPLLLSKVRSDGTSQAAQSALMAYESFAMELTGGNFQSNSDESSDPQIMKITHSGAATRTALARLRDVELKERYEDDPILRTLRSTKIWIAENNPLRRISA